MTPVNLGPTLDTIDTETDPQRKGMLLESAIASVFGVIPGLSLDSQDVINAFRSEEVDLIFWNSQHEHGLRFLDCPLIIECKGWSHPVSGREVRYFATELKDKGRRNGIFIALKGITGNEDNLTAAFFHVAAAMIDGVQVLVLTGDELRSLIHAEDLVAAFRRKLLHMTRFQIRHSKAD